MLDCISTPIATSCNKRKKTEKPEDHLGAIVNPFVAMYSQQQPNTSDILVHGIIGSRTPRGPPPESREASEISWSVKKWMGLGKVSCKLGAVVEGFVHI